MHGRRDRRGDLAALEQRRAAPVAMPRRGGVEHRSASERRLAAEDDAVAARRDDRLARAAAARSGRRPERLARARARCRVSLDARAVRDRLELVERRRRAGTRPGTRRGATSTSPRATSRRSTPGQADRDPLTRLGPLDVAIVHLDAANAHVAPRRLEAQLVAVADRARPERPGDDGAESRAARTSGRRRAASADRLGRSRRPSAARAERGAKLVEPCAGLRAHARRSRRRDELACLLHRELERLLVDRVDLRHRDDAVLDAEQPQDREVLVRLRPRALPGVDHEQEEVDPGRAGDHRPDEALVARARRRPRAAARRQARAARSRGRSRSRAAAPPAAGPCPSRSAPARATSFRGRCGRRFRPSAASRLDQAVLDRDRLQPGALEQRRHCGSVRSRPPASMSMSRSSHLAPSGSFPGSMTDSVARTRAPGRPAAIVRRIVVADSSSQSWMIPRGRTRRRRGTRSKKLPATNSSPVAEQALVAVGLGQVEHDSAQLGLAPEELDEQRAVATADVDDRLAVAPLELREPLGILLLPAGHREVEDRALVGMPASHDQKSCRTCPGSCRAVASRRVEVATLRRRRRRTDARTRPAASEQALARTRCCRKRPAPPRSKMPSLARARRTRCETIGVDAGLGASSTTRRGPSASASGDVEIGDDRERLRRHRAAQEVPEHGSGERSLMGVRRDRGGDLFDLGVGERAAVEQHAGRRGRCATTGGSPSRSGSASSSSTAHAALGSSASGSAPPPTRATVSSTSPPTSAREALGAGAHRLDRLVQHPQHRDLVPRRRVERERERALERRERELVRAQRALERMAAQPLDELGAADDDPGLRPAEQLVPGEADEVGARAQALRRRRLVADRRRARRSRGRRRAGARRARRPRRARREPAAR